MKNIAVLMMTLAGILGLCRLEAGNIDNGLDKSSTSAKPAKVNTEKEVSTNEILELKLSPEGKAELAKLSDKYPRFDEEKAIKEFNEKTKGDVEKKFPREKLKEVQAQAGVLFPCFKKGDTITVETLKKTYTGAYGGMVGDKLKVGSDLVPTIDLTQTVIDATKPDVALANRQQYISQNYSDPKKGAEAKLKKDLADYLVQQRAKIYNVIIQENKLLEKYPLQESKVANNASSKPLPDDSPVTAKEKSDQSTNTTAKNKPSATTKKVNEINYPGWTPEVAKKEQEDAAKNKPVLDKCTSEMLAMIKAYLNNKLNFESTYLDKEVKICGYISIIDRDNAGVAYIGFPSLYTDSIMFKVIMSESEIKKFNKRHLIGLSGTLTSYKSLDSGTTIFFLKNAEMLCYQ